MFGLLDNVPRALATLSAIATKNVTILSIATIEIYEIIANLQVDTKELVNDEKHKLSSSLTSFSKHEDGDQEEQAMFVLNKTALTQ